MSKQAKARMALDKFHWAIPSTHRTSAEHPLERPRIPVYAPARCNRSEFVWLFFFYLNWCAYMNCCIVMSEQIVLYSNWHSATHIRRTLFSQLFLMVT